MPKIKQNSTNSCRSFSENDFNRCLQDAYERHGGKILYDTPDEAALAWSLKVNPDSRRLNLEAATYIYESEDGKYFTLPAYLWAGEEAFESSDLDIATKRNGFENFKKVGIAHSHGAEDSIHDSEFFSRESEGGFSDIEFSEEQNLPIYLILPRDTLRKYTPGKGECKWYVGEEQPSSADLR